MSNQGGKCPDCGLPADPGRVTLRQAEAARVVGLVSWRCGPCGSDFWETDVPAGRDTWPGDTRTNREKRQPWEKEERT